MNSWWYKKSYQFVTLCQFNLFLSTEEQNHQARGEETPEGRSKKVIGSTNKHFEKTYPWPSVVFTNCTILARVLVLHNMDFCFDGGNAGNNWEMANGFCCSWVCSVVEL